MNVSVGEGAAKTRRAPVGRKMDSDTALGERCRKRLGRKQMTAGAAGRNEHRRHIRHQARLGHQTGLPAITISPASFARGRSRVSANSMPMP